MDKDVEIYTMEYYSSIKKQILPFAKIWMYLQGIMHLNKTDREGQIPYDLVYFWNIKTKQSIMKNQQ